MKYYSDKTKKLYSTEAELGADEKKFDQERVKLEKAKQAKSARAKEIEEAYKKVEEATKEYNKLVNKFVDDYGYYHSTISRQVSSPISLFDIISNWPW